MTAPWPPPAPRTPSWQRLAAAWRRFATAVLGGTPPGDLAVRATRTFLQAFCAVLTAAPVLDLSVPTLHAAAIAGVASLLALLQGLLRTPGD